MCCNDSSSSRSSSSYNYYSTFTILLHLSCRASLLHQTGCVWRWADYLSDRLSVCLTDCLTDCLSVQALINNESTAGAWDAIHALSYHTYTTDFNSIINETTSLYQQFSKPIWITEIASGSNSTMQANVALMQAFIPWANKQSWIERYFWNQAVS